MLRNKVMGVTREPRALRRVWTAPDGAHARVHTVMCLLCLPLLWVTCGSSSLLVSVSNGQGILGGNNMAWELPQPGAGPPSAGFVFASYCTRHKWHVDAHVRRVTYLWPFWTLWVLLEFEFNNWFQLKKKKKVKLIIIGNMKVYIAPKILFYFFYLLQKPRILEAKRKMKALTALLWIAENISRHCIVSYVLRSLIKVGFYFTSSQPG